MKIGRLEIKWTTKTLLQEELNNVKNDIKQLQEAIAKLSLILDRLTK